MIRKKAGSIINFSTIAVTLGLKGESIYAASKAGVEGFSRAFAREMADFDIRVNCIAPGPIKTDLLKGVSDEQIDAIVAQQILPKLFLPDGVADLCEFLLGPQSQSLSGQVLKVEGPDEPDRKTLPQMGGCGLSFSDSSERRPSFRRSLRPGLRSICPRFERGVVALIEDFDPPSILTLLRLIDLGVILVPLTVETREDHAYFFESAQVDVVIENGKANRRSHSQIHPLIEELRKRGNAGLVLFSTGTTGRPKAILHDFSSFLKRFDTPRPTLRTINFLLFDHIGGINTLLHTLFQPEAW